MDSSKAFEFVQKGATLLLLDVPEKTLIGIDTEMISSGPAFKGIKMIPPGVHFVYYSSTNREGNEFSAVIGFFVDAKPSEVIVRKWDHEEEKLLKIPEEEEERYIAAVKRFEFDRHLGPYTLERYGEWVRLSNYITRSTIDRLEPIGGEISVACECENSENVFKTSLGRELAEKLSVTEFPSSLEKSPRKGCYYTPIPPNIKRKGLTGAELTMLNLDKSQLLETLLVKEYEGAEDSMLAELQFSFIAFLMGQSLEAFVQWKILLSLLLGCTEAPLHTRSQFFTKFIKVIYCQLKFGFQKDEKKDTSATAGGLFSLLDESWLSGGSFLHHLCEDFFSSVLEASVVNGDLLTWTRKLKDLLEETLGWDFNKNSVLDDGIYFDEDDEFAPVVEMLDDYSEAPSP